MLFNIVKVVSYLSGSYLCVSFPQQQYADYVARTYPQWTRTVEQKMRGETQQVRSVKMRGETRQVRSVEMRGECGR